MSIACTTSQPYRLDECQIAGRTIIACGMKQIMAVYRTDTPEGRAHLELAMRGPDLLAAILALGRMLENDTGRDYGDAIALIHRVTDGITLYAKPTPASRMPVHPEDFPGDTNDE